MVSLFSFDLFISTKVQGFWSPLLTVPFGRLSLHPSPFLPTQSSATTLTSHTCLLPTMSPSTTPIIPSAPFSSLSSQATLENGFDHLRDWSSDGGYMRYGSQVSDTVITYAQVRGWDRNNVVSTHTLSFLERSPSLLRPPFS